MIVSELSFMRGFFPKDIKMNIQHEMTSRQQQTSISRKNDAK